MVQQPVAFAVEMQCAFGYLHTWDAPCSQQEACTGINADFVQYPDKLPSTFFLLFFLLLSGTSLLCFLSSVAPSPLFPLLPFLPLTAPGSPVLCGSQALPQP